MICTLQGSYKNLYPIMYFFFPSYYSWTKIEASPIWILTIIFKEDRHHLLFILLTPKGVVHIIRKCPCFTLQKLSYYVFWHVHTVLTDIWGALEPPLIRTLCLPPSCIKFTSACDDSSRSASPLATYLHAPPLLEICSKSHVCMYLSMYYLVEYLEL